MPTPPPSFTDRFSSYFDRPVALQAAKSISNGAEMEFQIRKGDELLETFTFTKAGGKNEILPSPAENPQITWTLTPSAAEEILADTTEEIGHIGVNIAKLIVSDDPERKVGLKFRAGFLALFSKGYFGIITAGGSAFASYLATRGLNGMSAIKAAFKKTKD